MKNLKYILIVLIIALHFTSQGQFRHSKGIKSFDLEYDYISDGFGIINANYNKQISNKGVIIIGGNFKELQKEFSRYDFYYLNFGFKQEMINIKEMLYFSLKGNGLLGMELLSNKIEKETISGLYLGISVGGEIEYMPIDKLGIFLTIKEEIIIKSKIEKYYPSIGGGIRVYIF